MRRSNSLCVFLHLLIQCSADIKEAADNLELSTNSDDKYCSAIRLKILNIIIMHSRP